MLSPDEIEKYEKRMNENVRYLLSAIGDQSYIERKIYFREPNDFNDYKKIIISLIAYSNRPLPLIGKNKKYGKLCVAGRIIIYASEHMDYIREHHVDGIKIANGVAVKIYEKINEYHKMMCELKETKGIDIDYSNHFFKKKMGDVNYCVYTDGCYCLNKNHYKKKLISMYTQLPNNVSELVCQYTDDDIHIDKVSYTHDLLCDTHLQKFNYINNMILLYTPLYGVIADVVCGFM